MYDGAQRICYAQWRRGSCRLKKTAGTVRFSAGSCRKAPTKKPSFKPTGPPKSRKGKKLRMSEVAMTASSSSSDVHANEFKPSDLKKALVTMNMEGNVDDFKASNLKALEKDIVQKLKLRKGRKLKFTVEAGSVIVEFQLALHEANALHKMHKDGKLGLVGGVLVKGMATMEIPMLP